MPRQLPNPKNPGHRTRAARLRKKLAAGIDLAGDDADWVRDYDDAQRKQGQGNSDFGASATERTVHIEERAAAVGTGGAAEAAAAAAMVREEGRRIDYLARTAIDALDRACKMYESIAAALLARTEALESVHLGMLDAVREQYIARTQAEVDALAAQNSDQGLEGLAQQLIASQLLPNGAAAPTAKKR